MSQCRTSVTEIGMCNAILPGLSTEPSIESSVFLITPLLRLACGLKTRHRPTFYFNKNAADIICNKYQARLPLDRNWEVIGDIGNTVVASTGGIEGFWIPMGLTVLVRFRYVFFLGVGHFFSENIGGCFQ